MGKPFSFFCLIVLLESGWTDDSGTCKPIQNGSLNYQPTDSLKPFYNLANSFIKVAQHNEVPYNQIQSTIDYFKNSDSISSASDVWTHIKPIVLAEVGFFALLILGLIFTICMPFFGCVFCCCRCCDNCGGKRVQEHPSTACCAILTILLLISFMVLLSGVILFSVNADAAWKEVPHVRDNAIGQIDEAINFAQQFVDQAIIAVDELVISAINNANKTISDIGDLLSLDVLSFSGMQELLMVSGNLTVLVNTTSSLSRSVEDFNTEAQILANETQQLIIDFSNYTNSTPSSADIDALINPSEAMILTKMISNLTDVEHDLNFIQLMSNALNSLNEAKAFVIRQAQRSLQQVKDAYKSVQDSEQNFKDKINNITSNINQFQSKLCSKISDQKISHYSWAHYVLLIFVIPIIAVLLCLFCGLCCGLIGNERGARPDERTSLSNCGGNCLIAAVAFAFVFSWILMLLTMIFFLPGFLFQTLACGPLFQDESVEMFNIVQNNVAIGDDNYNVNISIFVQSCRKNETLFVALNADQIFNITNLSDQINNVATSLNNTNFEYFNTSDVYTLSPAANRSLSDAFALLSQLKDDMTNYTAVTLSRNDNITEHILASMLTTLAIMPPSNATAFLKERIEGLQGKLSVLNSEKANLTSKVGETKSKAESLQELISYAQNNNLTSNGTINNINQQIPKIKSDITNAITGAVTNITNALRNDLGKCGSLYDIYKNVGDIACKEILYPWQAVWLALGWCLLWYIPTIILSVRLAKYFRRMDEMNFPNPNRYTLQRPEVTRSNKIQSDRTANYANYEMSSFSDWNLDVVPSQPRGGKLQKGRTEYPNRRFYSDDGNRRY